ncbi:hypothetical protein G6011_04432 [Alternaria panax]|uniref:Xylanolytic transcriptional activator regulatory domain-containing protein n=1 Tax=Alternaria panax TaxID=48097 RepID=A0AAD4IGH9_9PLEO|nr:hypothetical protein G6011_04432 [Alternaria panax]
MPCARCRSSGATCTYERVDHASSPATPHSDVHVHPGHSQAGDAGPRASAQRGGISIDFLLNFTNPSGYRPSATIAAEATELDDADGEAHAQLNPADQHMANHQTFFDFADVPSVFFGFPFLMGRDAEYPSPMINDSLTPELEDAYALEVRVRELIHQLSAQHTSMLERNDAVQTTFDIQYAESVFTVGNVRHFIWAFFRYFHYSFPILHKPTFSLQTASLPLVLTLVLFGSMSSNDSDFAIGVRQFAYVAEAYIFDKLLSQQMLQAPQPACISNEELELIQASLLYLVFMHNINELATRRRFRLQRMPSVTAAVRASGLFAYRRRPFITAQGTCDWWAFIADEMRSRVGMWTCIFESTVSIFFNTPPLIATSEMTGSMPCDEELFRAESATDFERVALLGRPSQDAYTLPELMSRLLFAPPKGNENEEEIRLSPTEMLILICG